ncbi:hypothetical protein EMIT0P265_150001 [Pseudomonas zeae]
MLATANKFAQLFSNQNTRIAPPYSEPEPLCQSRLTPPGCQIYRWKTWWPVTSATC